MKYINFILILFAISASAKIVDVDLYFLAKNSEIIAIAKIDSCEVSQAREKCSLSIDRTYKGKTFSPIIDVCNEFDSPEWPKLSKIVHDRVLVFLVMHSGCYRVFYGYRGLVRMDADDVYVGTISDMPERMNIEKFSDILISTVERVSR